MTVKETVILAAEKLGLGARVRGFLENNASEGKEETETLVRCFNVVENEVALDYLPLRCEDEAESETGVIRYEGGNAAPFKLFPSYLKTQPGRVRIEYTYTPEKKTAEDKSDYEILASPRLFAYGIAAEYCLACGLFEEAAVWDKKYKDALTAAYRSRPSRVIRSRRWA